ncbi:methyltransferase domain-containing protein [Vreelandella nanhaiensis]|uniref:Methyltransferase domain-containing protein n=1 Tax=Vreelandella nanhaiensis TaxID=1258546 RepID=A0A3S0YYD1_9GAMM|nr:methyltransferase domain-containing protein [Halomonas nanhaiensis]RUR32550.1 methyltransferase domain-containing protein [Halomonas nanhaiensis]
MQDFSQRSDEKELMDEDDISFEEFHDCLQGLERINHLTLAYRPTLQWLRPWVENHKRLFVLDAASGGGDMLRQIAKKWPARITGKAGHRLVGVDLNPWSKKSAESWAHPPAISYETANVFAFEPGQPIDIIISSLFTHHLTDRQIVDFLCWMDSRAGKGWFINDLHRHPIPYYFIKGATALFSRNRLIRNDAAVSVARALTVKDWRRLINEAGLDGDVRVQWFFPFRLCVSCNKEVPTR